LHRNTSALRSATLAIAALLAAQPRFVRGDVNSYIGPVLGNWTDPANWSLGLIPDSPAFDVLINAAAPSTLQLDASETINNLSLGSHSTLSLLTGTTLALSGPSLVNTGNIQLSASSSLFFNTSAAITGGGSISLAPSSLLTGASASLFTSDQLITGAGNLGGSTLKMINNGTISSAGGALTIAPLNATDGYTNNGLLLADNASLTLTGSTYINAGLMKADHAVLKASGTISGGTLTAVNGGVLQSNIVKNATMIVQDGYATFTALNNVNFVNNSTLQSFGFSANLANSTLSGNIDLQFTSFFTGNITNNGVMTLDFFSPFDYVTVNNVSLNGTGTLTLLAASTLSVFSGGQLVNNITINGSGVIGGLVNFASPLSGPFINNGLIAATAGTLSLLASNSVNFTNNGILRADHAPLRLGSWFSTEGAIVNNGTIEALDNSSVIVSASIQGGTIGIPATGSLTISGGTLTSVNFSLLGTLSTTGSLNLNGTIGWLVPSAPISGSISLGTSTAFTGAGALLINNATISTNFGNATFVNNSNISGTGALFPNNVATFTNKGTITASSGLLTIGMTSGWSGTLINVGTLRADGGTLVLPAFTNSGIVDLLPNSVVRFTGAIFGGTLSTVGGGTMNLASGTLTNVTLIGPGFTVDHPVLQGAITDLAGLTFPTPVTINGTLNAATVTQITGSSPLQYGTASAFTGAGTILLTGNPVVVGTSLTIANSVMGAARLIGNFINNKGTITASGGVINLNPGNATNSGLMQADTGSLLAINSSLNNTTGIVQALDGGTVVTGSYFAGGTLRQLPGGSVFLNGTIINTSFSGVAANGTSSAFLLGNNTNSGTLRFTSAPTFSGVNLRNTGVLQASANGLLNFNSAASTLSGAGTVSLINASVQIAVNLISDNLIVSGGTASSLIQGGTLTNAATIRAQSSCSLSIASSVINTSGLIEAAAGSTLTVSSPNIAGGTVSALEGATLLLKGARLSNLTLAGSMSASGTGSLVLDNVLNAGALSVPSGKALAIGQFASVLTNTGVISLASAVPLNAEFNPQTITLTGGGTLLFSQSSILPGVPLFITNNLLVGAGTLGSSSQRIYNSGTISVPTLALAIAGANATDSLVNTGLLLASGGSLTISSPKILNTGGTIQADSLVTIQSGTVTGGSLIASPGGTVSFTSPALAIQGAALSGNILATSQTLTLSSTPQNAGAWTLPSLNALNASAAILQNTGTITVGTSSLALLSNFNLGGNGTLAFSNLLGSITSTSAVRFTNSNAITGLRSLGSVNMGISNSGTISVTSGVLTITTSNATDSFSNSGLLLATGGTLSVPASTPRVLNAGGSIIANAAKIQINGTVTGGSLSSLHGGLLVSLVASGATLLATDGGTIQLGGVGALFKPLPPFSASDFDPATTYLQSDASSSIIVNGGLSNAQNDANLILKPVVPGTDTLTFSNAFTNNHSVTFVTPLSRLIALDNATISGTGSWIHLGPGTTTLSGPYAATGPITVAAGTWVFAETNAPRQSPTILLTTNSLSIANTGSVMDITNHDLMITNNNASSSNYIIDTLWKNGVAGLLGSGDPLGPQITSSTVNNNTSNFPTFIVAVDIDAVFGGGVTGDGSGTGSNLGGYTDNQVVTQPGTIMIKYGYYTDIDFSGKVDAGDINLILGGLGQTTPGFADPGLSYLLGDVDYSGKVDAGDINLVLGMLGAGSGGTQGNPLGGLDAGSGGGAALSGGTADAVPEPTSLALLGIGAAGMLARLAKKARSSSLRG
jgi:adhesin HecA-like repeat protein